MKLLSALFIIMISFTACNSNEENQDVQNQNTPSQNEPHIAKVIEKIDASTYTYMHVSENKKDYWIAVPQMAINEGEIVYFSKFMEMKNFKSETLNRTFDSVLFVEDARKSSTPDEMKNVHSGVMTVQKQDVKVEPLEDGKTIEQIYSSKSSLAGKTVRVKGKVVKFNQKIMNRNWIHIQDGTGSNDNYDLVVTSDKNVKVGDVITVEGIVNTDKDFGAGYFFPVIIEDAEVTID